jgi:hypothetical protein
LCYIFLLSPLDIARRLTQSRFLEYQKQNFVPETFPAVEIRKANMSAYNASVGADTDPSLYRQLSFYRPLRPVPHDLNLHICAHLFASDRNSLFLITNALGTGDAVGKMGSLSHGVVIHVRGEDMVIDKDVWWCQEAWTDRSGGGRGMHGSRIWKGDICAASTWQEGLIRTSHGTRVFRKGKL